MLYASQNFFKLMIFLNNLNQLQSLTYRFSLEVYRYICVNCEQYCQMIFNQISSFSWEHLIAIYEWGRGLVEWHSYSVEACMQATVWENFAALTNCHHKETIIWGNWDEIGYGWAVVWVHKLHKYTTSICLKYSRVMGHIDSFAFSLKG